MIEGLVLEGERACALAMLRSGVEHQHGVTPRVGIEHCEHRSLCLVRKVEIAVPGEDTLKPPAECQPAHVGDKPFLPRYPIARQRNHFRRRVYASHLHAVFYQETRDRLASPAAEVKHATTPGQLMGERLDPDPIIPHAAPTGRVPLHCVASIKVDDGFRRVAGYCRSFGSEFASNVATLERERSGCDGSSGRRQMQRSYNRRGSQTLADLRFRLRLDRASHLCQFKLASCRWVAFPAPNSVPDSLNWDHHDIGTPAKGGNP